MRVPGEGGIQDSNCLDCGNSLPVGTGRQSVDENTQASPIMKLPDAHRPPWKRGSVQSERTI
jgi:hypothetical protein